MEKSQTEQQIPKDPYHLVYIIVYWLGIGTLMPWNFFLAGIHIITFNPPMSFVTSNPNQNDFLFSSQWLLDVQIS